ncbi:MAG: pPPM1a 86 [Paenibacillaceae bacterium]|nr:pPPM1a 86 [Paenibacillaceae bacterium]
MVVPQAPVGEALPELMTFYIDTRFTATQVSRLRQMIGLVLANWDAHFSQIERGEVSNYQYCVNKYARFNLAPVWFEDKLANGAAAASVQMDGFTTMIAANGFGRAPKAYIMYRESGDSTISASNASDPETSPLSVTINSSDLSKTNVSTVFLSGSLQHAWLHREGYRHPAGKYTSYFAGEASMCLMRGNKDKTSTPSTTYTQWLD